MSLSSFQKIRPIIADMAKKPETEIRPDSTMESLMVQGPEAIKYAMKIRVADLLGHQFEEELSEIRMWVEGAMAGFVDWKHVTVQDIVDAYDRVYKQLQF